MSDTLKGVLVMVAGVALLTANDAVSKYLTQSHPVGQVICLRQAATLLVIVPYVMVAAGWGALRVSSWSGQLLRGGLFIANAALIVLAFSLLPLATVIVIMFSSPIFLALMSAPLLSERVTAERWISIVAGFVGVLIVIRPGATAFEWTLLIPVAASLANALRDIVTRRLSRTETSIAILFWSTIIVMGAGLLTAPFGWKPVSSTDAAWFVAAGVFNATAHFLIIEALRLGEASVISPVRYTSLIWAALLGYAVWGDVPSAWLLAGSAFIIAAGVYMIRVEARKGK
ncbi:MAG TPA: DMT family transporter [Burkholderiales bacterium]|nr:DMT family transporter [Burkholderiales bacterium]